MSTTSTAKKKKSVNVDRKAIVEKYYRLAVKKDETVTWAVSEATKEYGSKINKAEIQYWAMKNDLPYLDEMRGGDRVKVS